MNNWSEKVKQYFPDVALNKTVVENVGLRDKAIPSYVVDWLISRYSDGDNVDMNALNTFMERHLPDKTRKEEIKHRLIEGKEVQLLDSIKVSVDLARGEYDAVLSSLDLSTRIMPNLIMENPKLLHGDTWGQVKLSYRINDDTSKGEVWVDGFNIMQTGEIDLDYFIEQRKHFSLEEWMDMIVGSMGYNPDNYSLKQKMYLLMRLVPMVQPRVNLMELSPKGTGKSTIFSKLSSYVWLVSGGIVTRAKLLYDMGKKSEGIIAFYDLVVLDEVQTIKFSEPGEIVGALKGYLESGEYRVMGHRGTAESGFIVLANIKIGVDGIPLNKFVLEDLPSFMQETALMDRFHGILPGWELPRIQKSSLLISGYVLRSDYFSEILHLLRKKTEHSDYVKSHIHCTGDIRDLRAVERISTGLLKLLYPDLQVSIDGFERYCLDIGKELRSLLKEQMSLKDTEYKKTIANIEVV
jgi:ATP-dependent Lon protease